MTARYGHRTRVGESVSQTWGKPQTNLFPFPFANEITNTSFTTGATAHVKTGYVEMISSVSANCNLLMIDSRNSVSGADQSILIDIAVGPVGSEVIIAPNVYIGMSFGISPKMIPMTIPIGSRISGRIQANRINTTYTTQLKLYAGDTYGLPQSVETIGADISTSRSTVVSTNATWTELTASTSVDYQALILCPSNIAGAATQASFAVRLGVGAAGAETEIAIAPILVTAAENFATSTVGAARTIAGATTTLTNIYTTMVAAGSRLSLYVYANGGQSGGFVIGIPA